MNANPAKGLERFDPFHSMHYEKDEWRVGEGCGSTSDNLMIDKMVSMDCHRGKRNLSVAWVEGKKA